jgi:Pyruvate/2-oxoacid:ferredoxin oxidoreductase delta subunit
MIIEDKIYHQLRREIDERMPVGFPSTKDGLEIKILQLLFTPEEARIIIHLSALPEKLKKIYKRLHKNNILISKEKLKKLLDGLVEKGAILDGILINSKFIGSKKIGTHYSLAQFTPGIFDFQLDRLTKEFSLLSEEYLHEGFYKEIHRKNATPQLRTIPVEKSLVPEHNISTYDNIREIINDKVDLIAIKNCVCRQHHDIIIEACKLSDMRRVCVSFNNYAEFCIELGVAKTISKEELFILLDDFEKEGFILQSENSRNPSFLCVCCGCCCGVIKSVKKFPSPAEYYTSNYFAQINEDKCNGCKTCVKRCQLEAVDFNDNKARLNLDRCIGCGNCVTTCKMNAINLLKKEKVIIPPKNLVSLNLKILKEKRGSLGIIKMLWNYIRGKKT